MSGTAPVLVSLLQGLKDTEWEVRARSACALGDLAVQAKGAIPALVSLLRDPHWYVRGRSAWALAKIGVESEEDAGVLVQALQDEHWLVRSGACCGLGRVTAGSGVVPALLHAVKDQDPYVRQNAAWALGQTFPLAKASGDAAAVRQSLMEALKDEAIDVRSEANMALEALDRGT
jgi:HEAT repeat protein